MPEIINGNDFTAQMQRFIPMNVQQRTLNKAGYYQYMLNEITALYQHLIVLLNGAGEEDIEFRL